MARKHYWQFLVTEEGNPIENAQISIYTAGTEDPVYIFTDEVGSGSASSAPQTVTSRKGYFEFWIADENETNGYPLSTKFKIAWQAAGVSSGYIDYVDVFSTSWAPVDETDTNTLKNKAVSNFLAKGWEDHKSSMLPGETPHGLDFVVETDTDSDRNKVISNYQAFLWDYHGKRIIDPVDGVLKSVTISSPNQLSDMHGIQQTSVVYDLTPSTNGDEFINKLVSEDFINRWQDHVLNNTEDHTQYPLLTGRPSGRLFSAPMGYDGSVLETDLSTDDFITVGMIGNRQYLEDVVAGDYNPVNTDGTYTVVITHGLLTLYPSITVYDSLNEVVQPIKIYSTSNITTEITMSTAAELHVIFIR